MFDQNCGLPSETGGVKAGKLPLLRLPGNLEAGDLLLLLVLFLVWMEKEDEEILLLLSALLVMSL